MNIIYRLVNKLKKSNNQSPCYYIGSKMNYIPGKYWGSSKHPILLEELKDCISNFEIEILEFVENPKELAKVEREYQLKFNVLADPNYYNLQLANEKFNSIGRKWYYDPITLTKGYFQESKIPIGWIAGYKPESKCTNTWNKIKNYESSGFKKGDPELHKQISDSVSSIEWILQAPDGSLHTVTKLHKFCKENGITDKLRLAANVGVPMKSGKSKGWCVLSKKTRDQ